MNSKYQNIVDEIFERYHKFGDDDYIGEPVSQLEHMSQAAQLAKAEGYDDEVILAAFFHDIGHLCSEKNEGNMMDGYGVMRHEQIGAAYLRANGFPARIAKLVENHVQAKRYLTFKNPDYYDSLSEASKKTLEFQGGVMRSSEAIDFEHDDLFEVSIKMRYWDEKAKEINIPIMDLEYLRKMAFKVLEKKDGDRQK